MKLPQGVADQGKYVKLNRALYGLKQAPRIWYQTLATYLGEPRLHAA